MGSIVVRHLDRDKPPIGRLYVAVHTKEQEPLREYVQATTIRGISPERAQAIEEARRLLMGIRRRFAYLSELEAVWAALDEEIG
jgi:hypothetical protein